MPTLIDTPPSKRVTAADPAATPFASRLPAHLLDRLALPVIAAPMFLVSSVAMVVAACRSGVIGALPAANARTPEIFEQWLLALTSQLDAAREQRVAPWAVNLVLHRSNRRLGADAALCVKYQAPIVITALGSPKNVVEAVHGYGGLVFADVNTPEYAAKAAKAGVDGLVLVCAGAGGHTGHMAAAAFVAAVREFFDGIIVVAGAVCNGAAVRSAQILGADLVHVGTRFIATEESMAVAGYKEMLVASTYEDIICTQAITGAWANKLRPSLVRAGLDPDNLQPRGAFDLSNAEEDTKAWKDLWSAGQGVGQVKAVEPMRVVVDRLKAEYDAALSAELDDPWMRRFRATAC